MTAHTLPFEQLRQLVPVTLDAAGLAAVYNEGYDAGAEDVWNEPVCARCDQNHDRDESASCEGADAVPFSAWVAMKRG